MMRHWHYSPAVALAAMTLHHGPDAGGGSGAPQGGDGDPGAGGGDDAGTDGDQGDGGDPNPEARGAGDDAGDGGDGDDEEDEVAAARAEFGDAADHDPRVKKLLQKLGRFQRRDKRQRGFAQVARALGVERPEQLRELYESGTRGRAIETTTRERSGPPAREPQRDEDPRNAPLPEDLAFEYSDDDLAKAGWDLRDPLNAALTARFKGYAQQMHEHRLAIHRLVNVVRALNTEVGGARQETRAERSRRESEAIRSEVTAAAGQIRDKDLALAFRKAVHSDYTQARQRGQQPDIKAICAENLRILVKKGQITSGEAARANAKRQQMADRNRTSPQSAALSSGGAPSGAPTRDRSKETIRSIHRKEFGNGFVGALGRR